MDLFKFCETHDLDCSTHIDMERGVFMVRIERDEPNGWAVTHESTEPVAAIEGAIRQAMSYLDREQAKDAREFQTLRTHITLLNEGDIIIRGYCTLHPDGTITLENGYTPDAAAQAFWDALQLIAAAYRSTSL